jgi:CheY-like chemotaxis protein/HPt (histidine-containing phosphotransfer) domain-containing protein
VRQILFNLLSNALKFTSVGEVGLAVSNAAGGRIEFKVADSGVGMDEATQARLFQRFMQGDERPSRRTSGTGLGLQISRDLARLMGGDITVQSQPGQGSVFTVSLPLASVGAPTQAADASDSAGTGHSRPLRVLVAEDHAVNRAYLEAVLEKLGHRGVFVGDGHGAVLAVQAQPPDEPFDVVLMDLHMPDMDGFTAARTIRAMPPPKGRVPIVALTADAFQTSRELAREAGMEGFLTKPAHLPQLREALQRYGAGSTAPLPELAATEEVSADIAAPASLLDMATVSDVMQALTESKYAELLDRFFAEREATMTALRRALADASSIDLQSRAHSLKGASASLGLRAISALAQQVQVSDPGPRPDELARLLDRLEEVFELTRAECLAAGLMLTPPAAPAPA